MIICEGPDGGGKSTLVGNILRRYDMKLVDHGRRDRLWTNDVRGRVYEALSEATRQKAHLSLRLYDRLFFSELCYSPILRGQQPAFNQYERDFIHRVLEALKCPIIICLPPKHTVHENVLHSEQLEGVREKWELIYDWYFDLYTEGWFPGLNFVRYDFTDPGDDAWRQAIEDYYTLRSNREW